MRRMFQNKIPTKDNLVKRGVLDIGLIRCVGECGIEESVSNLFFYCSYFAGIWYSICHWLGISTMLQ